MSCKHNSHVCEWVAEGATGAGLFVGSIASGGAGTVLGIAALGTGAGDLADLC